MTEKGGIETKGTTATAKTTEILIREETIETTEDTRTGKEMTTTALKTLSTTTTTKEGKHHLIGI